MSLLRPSVHPVLVRGSLVAGKDLSPERDVRIPTSFLLFMVVDIKKPKMAPSVFSFLINVRSGSK